MKTGFRYLTVEQRREYLARRCGLTPEERRLLWGAMPSYRLAEHLIENPFGYFQIPLGVATHFEIDGHSRLIPMAVEESSIIAAASATAKWVCSRGCIRTRMEGKRVFRLRDRPAERDHSCGWT